MASHCGPALNPPLTPCLHRVHRSAGRPSSVRPKLGGGERTAFTHKTGWKERPGCSEQGSGEGQIWGREGSPRRREHKHTCRMIQEKKPQHKFHRPEGTDGAGKVTEGQEASKDSEVSPAALWAGEPGPDSTASSQRLLHTSHWAEASCVCYKFWQQHHKWIIPGVPTSDDLKGPSSLLSTTLEPRTGPRADWLAGNNLLTAPSWQWQGFISNSCLSGFKALSLKPMKAFKKAVSNMISIMSDWERQD